MAELLLEQIHLLTQIPLLWLEILAVQIIQLGENNTTDQNESINSDAENTSDGDIEEEVSLDAEPEEEN